MDLILLCTFIFDFAGLPLLDSLLWNCSPDALPCCFDCVVFCLPACPIALSYLFNKTAVCVFTAVTGVLVLHCQPWQAITQKVMSFHCDARHVKQATGLLSFVVTEMGKKPGGLLTKMQDCSRARNTELYFQQPHLIIISALRRTLKIMPLHLKNWTGQFWAWIPRNVYEMILYKPLPFVHLWM